MKASKTIRILAGALVLAAAAGSAFARNDRLLLPIAPALQYQGPGPALQLAIPLQFGRDGATAGDGQLWVEGRGQAVPYAVTSGAQGNTREFRPDAEVCRDAFRKALAELQYRAQAAGAKAVVGIVSYYRRQEFNNKELYECHAGNSRAVVDLRGRLSHGEAAPQPVPAPSAMTAPLPTAAANDQPSRIATGFAAIDDVDAIPYLNDRGRAAYREWLQRPTPRAFAISSTGSFYATAGLKPADQTLPNDPNQRALVGCERHAKVACKLYAVNGAVVWSRE